MSKSTIEDPEGFVAGLLALNPKARDYEARVKAHCLGALTRLSTAKYRKAGEAEASYGLSLTSKRRAVTRYRNAIRESLGEAHCAMRFMRVKDTDQDTVHSAYRRDVVVRHNGRRALDVERHVEIARSVLQRSLDVTPPLEIAAAIIAVTGRRPSEVLRDLTPEGDFRTCASPSVELFDRTVKERWSIGFAGQRKTRGAQSAQTSEYEIPVLVEPQLILAAIAALRKRYPCEGLTDEAVGSKTSSNLGRYTKGGSDGFRDQESPGYHDRAGDPLTPKDLRAAYATCAYEWFAPRKMSWNAYCSRILGHSSDDLLTSFSYDVFYPHGSKRGYEGELHDAALALLAQLRKDLKKESDEVKRGYIQQRIDAVTIRLKADA